MNINFRYSSGSLVKEKSECLVFFLSQKDKKNVNHGISLLPKPLQSTITQATDLNKNAGKYDTIQLLLSSSPSFARVLLVGLGDLHKVDLEKLRRVAGKVGKKLVELKLKKVSVFPPAFLKNSLKSDMGVALAEGISLGAYSYLEYKTDDLEKKQKEMKVTLCDVSKVTNKKALNLGMIKGNSTNYARTLGNKPPNDLTPSSMAAHATAIAKEHKMKITVLDEKKMKSLGMDMLLGVSKGSKEPAKLIIMEYTHKKSSDTIALVGKGLTFDSGGISLKPGSQMDEMKFDMCGGGAVLGAMKAVGELRPEINVIGVVPTSENLPGGNAQRPGDIVKSYAGKKVEILNTDAEGRLILGDALTYVAKKFKPDAIVDIATLTGACLIALGKYASGAITNNEELCEKVVNAGKSSGERVWPLPNFEEYAESIKGKYGDLQNIGNREAGTISAGLFLKNFVEEIPWIHIDIAGTAWGVKGIGHIPNSGATGVGVRLFIDLINNWKK
ncbi:MAG: leucyl aminopeptidase [Proteobacteria bacterium]|nr:leucyl aminopeptidase [Pseudomonadota bacterium]